MASFPPLRELPDKFHTIVKIRSVELKTKLTERIVIILNLIKFFDSFEPNPKTINKVNQFLTYLTISCEDPKKINNRAIWLLKYATLVELYLLEVQQGSLLTRVPIDLPLDHPMVVLLQQLESLLVHYTTYLEWSEKVILSEGIMNLTGLGSLVVVDPDNIKYTRLCATIQDTISTVKIVSVLKVIPDKKAHQALLYQFRHIRYLINEYVFTRVIKF